MKNIASISDHLYFKAYIIKHATTEENGTILS